MAYCRECGASIDEAVKFCPECGTPAGVETAAPPEEASPPPTSQPMVGGAKTTKKAVSRKTGCGCLVVAIIAVIIIVGALFGTSDKGTSTSKKSPADKARAYIKAHGTDAKRVQANVGEVSIAVLELKHSPTQANLNQVALAAQMAHDNLDAIRDSFADVTTLSGDLDNAGTELFTAANDLKNAMGALVAYTGNPNAGTLAQFTAKFQTAVAGWNHGVRAIWKAAGTAHPPII